MNAALIGQIVGYLVQYGPAGVQVVTSIIQGYKRLTADGRHVPTDAELKALVDKAQAQHDALSVPE